MTLSLMTPEKELLDNLEVTQVVVPGIMGQLGILPGHAPLVSSLASGLLRYYTKDRPEGITMPIHSGYFEVQMNRVIILAENAD